MQKIYCIAVDGVEDFSAGIMLNSKRMVFKALSCNQAFYTRGSGFNALALAEKPPAGINYAIGFVVK